MRKLALDLGDLRVESFATGTIADVRGTVQGRGPDPEVPIPPGDGSTDCDDGGYGSLFGTCWHCPSVGTCVGPTYCCTPTWRPTCSYTCAVACLTLDDCGA
jgi:hypothetical protein